MNDLAADKVNQFFEGYRTRQYAKGQVLLLSDEPVKEIYYLLKGRVKQYDVSAGGEEIILNIYKAGSFFPVSNIINQSISQQIFAADTDIEIKQAAAEAVLDFLQTNPDVVYDLLSRVYRGMDGLLGRLVQLMSGTARRRVLYEVIIDAKRFGERHENNGYSLNLIEKDIAARAGLTRETVSREVHRLKDEGLLTIKERHLVVNDIEKLKEQLLVS